MYSKGGENTSVITNLKKFPSYTTHKLNITVISVPGRSQDVHHISFLLYDTNHPKQTKPSSKLMIFTGVLISYSSTWEGGPSEMLAGSQGEGVDRSRAAQPTCNGN